MKAAILVAAAAALAGCGTARTVQVKVPVPVECRVQTPARPAMPLDALRPPYDVDTWVAHAIAEIETREAFEKELAIALSACAANVPTRSIDYGERRQPYKSKFSAQKILHTDR